MVASSVTNSFWPTGVRDIEVCDNSYHNVSKLSSDPQLAEYWKTYPFLSRSRLHFRPKRSGKQLMSKANTAELHFRSLRPDFPHQGPQLAYPFILSVGTVHASCDQDRSNIVRDFFDRGNVSFAAMIGIFDDKVFVQVYAKWRTVSLAGVSEEMIEDVSETPFLILGLWMRIVGLKHKNFNRFWSHVGSSLKIVALILTKSDASCLVV